MGRGQTPTLDVIYIISCSTIIITSISLLIIILIVII